MPCFWSDPRIAENNAEAIRLRRDYARAIAGEPPRGGGILAVLWGSPLVGIELDLEREEAAGRAVDL